MDESLGSGDRIDRISLRAQSAKAAIEAMREFCERVDRGEVQSRYTYAKFKAIIEDYDRS
jgi:hypothetical protein